MTDVDKANFIESNNHGGLSTICHKLANANNKYMTNYDKDKEDIFIQYLDVNNLYGWSMMEKLPNSNEDQLKIKRILFVI